MKMKSTEEKKPIPIEIQMIPLLLEWYKKEKRSLPWREATSVSNTQRAYHVWVSEIMLQQTRVEAVKPYYTRFLEALPTIEDLATVEEERLLKLWEGLGYYNRVRNMQKAAQVIMEDYQGEFPKEYEKVLALPGIGSYTAGAVCSISFGVPVPAVDGNVLRVISRVLAKDWDIAKQSVKTEVEQMLLETMPKDAPGEYNQALMELGATVCVPNGIAKCESCPVAHLCLAYKDGKVLQLPVKSQKKPRRIEEKTVLILKGQEQVALAKRPNKGLLAGLWEFPNMEGFLNTREVLDRLKEQGVFAIRIRELPMAKHIFSHVEWHMKGYLVQLDETEMKNLSKKSREKGDSLKEAKEYTYVSAKEIGAKYAIPSAFAAYKPYISN